MEKKEKTKVVLIKGGPMMISGNFEAIDSSGHAIVLTPTQLKFGMAFCRCGKSESMPLCDGSHVK